MDEDIREIAERIEFAQSEIEALRLQSAEYGQREISLFQSPTPGRLGVADVILATRSPVPIAIRSKAGMIANELRSCLDGLACVLAVRNGKTASETWFPVSGSSEGFETDGARKMRKLSDADKQTIRDLKPYRGGNDLLFALHRADIKRKHTKLAGHVNKLTSLNLGGMIGGRGTEMISLQRTWFNDLYIENFVWFGSRAATDNRGTVLATGAPPGLSLEVGVGLFYEEPEELSRKEVVPTLAEFAELVRSIVCRFDRSGEPAS